MQRAQKQQCVTGFMLAQETWSSLSNRWLQLKSLMSWLRKTACRWHHYLLDTRNSSYERRILKASLNSRLSHEVRHLFLILPDKPVICTPKVCFFLFYRSSRCDLRSVTIAYELSAVYWNLHKYLLGFVRRNGERQPALVPGFLGHRFLIVARKERKHQVYNEGRRLA